MMRLHGHFPESGLAGQLLPLTLAEEADNAVFAVIAPLDADIFPAHFTPMPAASKGAAGFGQSRQRGMPKYFQFRP